MRQARISKRDHYIALSLGLLSGLFLSLAGAFGKSLTTFSNLTVIIFIRFFAPLILIFIFYFFIQKKKIPKLKWPVYLLRAIFVVISQYCLFFLLSRGSVLLAILLYSTSGIFSPVLGRILFQHEIKIKTLIAIVLGFIGVGVTLGPTIHASVLNVVIGLLSGFLAACSQVSLHYASKKQDPILINLLNYGLSSLFSLMVMFIWRPSIHLSNIDALLSWYGAAIILLFSISSIGNQISRSLAYARINKAASLAPYLYSSLVFSAFIDWIWLDIIPVWYTYVGVTIIILSGLIMSIRLDSQKWKNFLA